MSYTAPKGVFDILPFASDEWRSSRLWQHIERVIQQTAKDYGFQEIRTPMFERTELFVRSVGENSDIVSKEMYTFLDKGDRSMTLRPEGTASVMRALIESKVLNDNPIQKVFYTGPMFRYERPQAGRYRQHHQFGAEAIGVQTPEQDVEIIDLLLTTYDRLGLKNLQVVINSIGNNASRIQFREALCAYLHPHLSELSEDSQRRFKTNPLRILDSKQEKDRRILQQAPSILDSLDSDSSDYFEAVKKHLTALNIDFTVNPSLVRGLDYYNGTVFEVMTEDLGAQNSIGGGGRYDGLVKQLGGGDLPSIGFGSGMERVLQTMIKQKLQLPELAGPLLYLIPLGEHAKILCFKTLHQLRQQSIPTEMAFSERKLKKTMAHAHKISATYTVVIGDDEIEKDQIEIREMSSGKITTVPLSNLALEILKKSEKL